MQYKKIAVIGTSSNLSKSLISKLEHWKVSTYGRNQSSKYQIDVNNIDSEYISGVFSTNYNVYIFNLGLLNPKNITSLNENEIFTSLKVNALFTICASEYILSVNPDARIFIMGSESGRKGSFDTTYFLAKTMLRSYVRQRYLSSSEQQLLLVSPSTILDSKMTSERSDKDILENYRQTHPKKRFLTNDEISNYMVSIIENESTYLTNTEIEINGGKFSRMRYQ